MTGGGTLVLAEVLAIGDELVHGTQLDTNSRWLAQQLEAHGATVERFTVVGDGLDALARALAQACERADLVVTTGGLGPTLDDRPREVVAGLLGGPLWFHEESWQYICQLLRSRRRPVPDSNRRQAEFPPGAIVLENSTGTAPGFRVRLHRAELFCLPGVSREMRKMAESLVLPYLTSLPGGAPIAQHAMRVVGPPEAQLGDRLAGFLAPGREPAVGITASAGQLTVRIVARGADPAAASAACAACASEIRPLLGDWLIAEGERELHEVVVDRLARQRRTLALAESCTGGLGSSRLVAIPGASAVFRGGVVAYSDDAKTALLGVDADLLDQHGAVSEPVAAAMAKGAQERLGTQLAVAITGIAGPGGGTAEKPVGTVCLALRNQALARTWTVRLPDFGRTFIRERSVLELWVALLRELGT